MEEVEVTIIGAGVVGLAIAAEVSRNREVYVLEKNDSFGQETSSRNSEVIHAGIYYPGGSLKAKLCKEGNALIYELCDRWGVGYKRLGKLIVATEDKEVEELEGLLNNGRQNGIALELLSREEVKKLEPEVNAKAAVFSPATGIIDCYGLMRYFAGAAVDNHARIVYKAKVAEIEHLSGGYKVTVADTTGNFSFLTTILINAAGLNSAQIAGLAGIDIAKAGYELHYCKGEYFSIPRRLSTRLVYPMPRADEGGLGVHITPDLEGKMRMGPNAIYVDSIDYKVDESGKQKFYESAKKLFPAIKYDELEPDFAGIRPKLQGKGEGFRDFVIRHEHDKGLDGLINLIGIESPGLTASPAIGRYVKSMVDQIS